MTTHSFRERAWPFLRLATGVLIIAAVLAQLVRTVQIAQAAETPHGSHVPTVLSNFFSFFTIQSNVLAAAVLIISALWTWSRSHEQRREPRWISVLLVCVTSYMLVTGIVYNVLLRGIELPQGQTVPWSNEVLHLVAPLIVLIDLIFAPGRRALPWSATLLVLIYPIAWVVYTMVRGPLVTSPSTGEPWWYPYPFLNPHGPGGNADVIFYIVVIALTIALVAWGVVALGRRRGSVRD